MLDTKPAALSVGRGDVVGCVRDIVAVGDGALFKGDDAGCWMRSCHVLVWRKITSVLLLHPKNNYVLEVWEFGVHKFKSLEILFGASSVIELWGSAHLRRFEEPSDRGVPANARIFPIELVCPMVLVPQTKTPALSALKVSSLHTTLPDPRSHHPYHSATSKPSLHHTSQSQRKRPITPALQNLIPHPDLPRLHLPRHQPLLLLLSPPLLLSNPHSQHSSPPPPLRLQLRDPLPTHHAVSARPGAEKGVVGEQDQQASGAADGADDDEGELGEEPDGVEAVEEFGGFEHGFAGWG